MNYKDYTNARNMSWQILADEHINELPIQIITLCKNLGIVCKAYDTNFDKRDGFSLIVDDVPHIYFNKDSYIPRKRFTVAHELGHILLGHVGKYELVNREPSSNDNEIEQQANIFASRLLAPACVLWGCKVTNAEEIEQLCGISKKAAEFRMGRMEELYQRNKFLTSPLEKQVYENFSNYIKTHQHQEDF